MNDETLLQREEKQELFHRLVDLTERGKIHWECEDYIPISFMDKDMLEGKPAYLTQMFTLTLQVQNTFYKMEIDEYLTVPDGKGDIHFKLTRPTKDNYLELETAFSFDSAYDNHTAEELGKACKEHPITRMAAAIARDMENREEVLENFEWADFAPQKGVSKKLLNHPLVRLSEKLFNERRVLDFHRIVFDIPYRKSLMEK